MSLFGPCSNCFHSHGGVSPADNCPDCDCANYNEGHIDQRDLEWIRSGANPAFRAEVVGMADSFLRAEVAEMTATVKELRQTVFALVGVLLEAGDPKSPLGSMLPEEQSDVIEETARMAAKALGIEVPEEYDRKALGRAIVRGYFHLKGGSAT